MIGIELDRPCGDLVGTRIRIRSVDQRHCGYRGAAAPAVEPEGCGSADADRRRFWIDQGFSGIPMRQRW
jgi:hypothetical protein